MRPIAERIADLQKHAEALRPKFPHLAVAFDKMAERLAEREDPWDETTVDTREEDMAAGAVRMHWVSRD